MIPPTRIALDPRYDGPLAVSVVLAPWKNDLVGDRLVQLVEGMLQLADRGAFVRAAVHPSQAQTRITSTRHASPTLYEWHVNARYLDHRFTLLFRNQMNMFSEVFSPVMHSTIVMLNPPAPVQPHPLPPIDEEAAASGDAYPPVSQHLGFSISHGLVADYAKDRRAEVELAGIIEDATLEGLREWFDAWAIWLDCAYAWSDANLDKGRNAFFNARTDIIDDITIETAVEYWGPPEVAWNSYVNLVGGAEATFGRVNAVRIY